MSKIGFLVNPIAGMGGSVGLKGTDGKVQEALKLGAIPKAAKRADEALQGLKTGDVIFLTSSGQMGENILKKNRLNYEVCYSPRGEHTTGEDTKNACRKFAASSVDLILFCGGDGTARDIYDVVKDTVPIIGIPAGVKMHSAVFAVNPHSIPWILNGFLEGNSLMRDAEIMDTDEEAFRNNRLETKVFGYAKTIYQPELIQGGKRLFQSGDEKQAKREIAEFAREFMNNDWLYILGPGTTVKSIADAFGIEKTLLGTDVIRNGELIARDANEKLLLETLDRGGRAMILVSPIGRQGFIFGRGNQQISPRVIRKVGVDNITILATPHKLQETPFLLVDTGDSELDIKLSGSREVVCGYRLAQRKDVRSP